MTENVTDQVFHWQTNGPCIDYAAISGSEVVDSASQPGEFIGGGLDVSKKPSQKGA
jgi:hypothetical protein